MKKRNAEELFHKAEHQVVCYRYHEGLRKRMRKTESEEQESKLP